MTTTDANENNSFQDSKNRSWSLSLTYGDIRRVQRRTGVNLTLVLERQMSEEDLMKIKIEEAPPVLRLQYDDLLFLDVILAIVEPQLREAEVSRDTLEESITPECLAKAKPIFWRLYNDFFLQSGDRSKIDLIQDVMPLSPEDNTDELQKGQATA